MQTIVKKWFQEKESGFLDNGQGPDISVRKADLVKCTYLKVGAKVEFECHPGKRGLIAKKVKLASQNRTQQGNRERKPYRPGVMT